VREVALILGKDTKPIFLTNVEMKNLKGFDVLVVAADIVNSAKEK